MMIKLILAVTRVQNAKEVFHVVQISRRKEPGPANDWRDDRRWSRPGYSWPDE
jgi:hypothetical protein